MAPGLGLYLAELYFTAYNDKQRADAEAAVRAAKKKADQRAYYETKKAALAAQAATEAVAVQRIENESAAELIQVENVLLTTQNTLFSESVKSRSTVVIVSEVGVEDPAAKRQKVETVVATELTSFVENKTDTANTLEVRVKLLFCTLF